MNHHTLQRAQNLGATAPLSPLVPRHHKRSIPFATNLSSATYYAGQQPSLRQRLSLLCSSSSSSSSKTADSEVN